MILWRTGLIVLGQATLFLALAHAQQAAPTPLRIGSSDQLALDSSGGNEEGALESLKEFIRSETGYGSEILKQKDWQELAMKLSNKQLHLGVFHGYEFAWAREKNAKLRPLALAVNVDRYRDAHVLVRQDSKATNLVELKGQTFALSKVAIGHVRLFLERKIDTKEPGKFFSKVTEPANIEDAIDDVVDGVVQATIVDRVGLEAYQRRKPGRFAKLKVIEKSGLFVPPLVAYHEGDLDEATQKRFREGLLNARETSKGKRFLNLYKLTAFEPIPEDFEKTLAEMAKAYPAR